AAGPVSAGRGAEAAATGHYNDKIVHWFTVATVFWGIVGMAVGVLIAAQLYWPALNFDTPWLSYGRDRKSTRLNSSHVKISYAVPRDLPPLPTRRSSDLGGWPRVRRTGRGGRGHRPLQRQDRPLVHRRDGLLGHRRHGRGRADRRPAVLAGAQLRHPVAELRAAAPAAHQRRDLRLRRDLADRHQPVRRAAHLPHPADLRQAGDLRVLGLEPGHGRRGDHPAAGHHP